jgi:ATP-dependent Lon protease
VIKEYQINNKNVEKFLDIPPTDDVYYQGINKGLPIGSSNGLAYVDDGQGTVLKIQFVKKEYGNKKEEKKDDDNSSASGHHHQPTGHLTHTGRLGDVMKESVEVVKIAVFNFLI